MSEISPAIASALQSAQTLEQLRAIYGGEGLNFIGGGIGNDILIGGNWRDDVYGGAGNGELRGNGGNDYLNGGAGHDRLYGVSAGMQADAFVQTEDRTPFEYIIKPLRDQIAKAFRER